MCSIKCQVCVLVIVFAFYCTGSRAQLLKSLGDFCTNQVKSIEYIYHVGDYLLLSINKRSFFEELPYSSNKRNKFYVYNWKTGLLYHRALTQDDLFVDILRTDQSAPRGSLLFATTLRSCSFTVHCEVDQQEDRVILVTYSSDLSNAESVTCQDHERPLDYYLRTHIYRMNSSLGDKFLPKMISHGTDVDLLKYRGQIDVGDWGDFITIRRDLTCGEEEAEAPSQTEYQSGFYIIGQLWVQRQAGFVQLHSGGSEMPIAHFLNCGLPMFSPIRALPRRLRLLTSDRFLNVTIEQLRAVAPNTPPSPSTSDVIGRVLVFFITLGLCCVGAYFIGQCLSGGVEMVIHAIAKAMLEYDADKQPPAYCARLGRKQDSQ